EAHQAVVFAFNITDEGIQLDFDHTVLREVFASIVRSYKKGIGRLKNRVWNSTYPMGPKSFCLALFGGTSAALLGRDPTFGCGAKIESLISRFVTVPAPYNRYLAVSIFSGFSWLAVARVYKSVQSQLLAYHGWMYEVRGPTSWRTKLWYGACRVLLWSSGASLFSFQGCLPTLPVPPVKKTVDRYLLSMEPLLSESEMAETRALARDFLAKESWKLQFYLKLKYYWTNNYVSDWWEEFVYLYSRDPIMVNSNYYGVDAVLLNPSNVQVARAANMAWGFLRYWRNISRQTMQPLMVQNLVPLCSWQYERQFATTRIPGEERDYLMHLNDTRHIAVFHSGRFYKVYFHYGNRWLEPCELEAQFQRIVDDKSPPAPGEAELAALTAGERKVWARARKDFFRRGVNKTSLDAVERAAFVLVLDDEEADYDPKDDSKLDHFAKSLLHGNGRNRWFDKSFSLIVFANGRVGVNCEHSWADAPVMSQMWEAVVFNYDIVEDCYRSNGHCRGQTRNNVPNPIRLQWDLNDACRSVIASQLRVATDLLNDVDLHLVVHRQFGKGAMKRCSMSPDAFIQLALQLAYFRDSGGEFCLTYEASMTRLFKEGRTETVRSCTNESCAFVRAMESGASNEEVVRLLRQASEKHQTMYRDAMTGKGVDRHLFTLYVVSKYCKTQSPFLEKALHCQWKLSTSQTPHGQTNVLDLEKHPDFLSAGGGFGPVSQDGYGVSYIIAGENTVFFHVSSRVSCDKTDSKRFGGTIVKALADLRTLLEEDVATKKKAK
ncbi:hypothetical protein BOX15_Mlig017169g2, partial [Macrostomum lignano]